MALQVIPATAEYEEATRLLLHGARFPIREANWERAMRSDRPNSSSPYVVVDTDDHHLTGFVMVKPVSLYYQSSPIEAAIFWDCFIAPGDDEKRTRDLLLAELAGRHDFVLAGGWSAHGIMHLRAERWRHLANMPRYHYQPKNRRQQPVDTLPVLKAPIEPEVSQRAMSLEDWYYLFREEKEDSILAGGGECGEVILPLGNEPNDGYARLTTLNAKSNEAMEWHLVDVRGGIEALREVPRRVKLLSEHTGQPVYASFMQKFLHEPLLESGWTQLPPRWGLFAFLGNQEYRDLFQRLSSESPFHLFAADLELDR